MNVNVGDVRFLENLAAGTGSSYGIQAAVKSWTDEVCEYRVLTVRSVGGGAEADHCSCVA